MFPWSYSKKAVAKDKTELVSNNFIDIYLMLITQDVVATFTQRGF
jgi:hypothetical protein